MPKIDVNHIRIQFDETLITRADAEEMLRRFARELRGDELLGKPIVWDTARLRKSYYVGEENIVPIRTPAFNFKTGEWE